MLSPSCFLSPFVREPRCHTRHDSIVRLCMFGLFRHVGKKPARRAKEVCVITASRACDLHSRTINHPIIVPPLTVTPPNVARVASSLQLHVPTHKCAFPSPEGHWQPGGGGACPPNHHGYRFRGGEWGPQSLEPLPLIPSTGGPKRRLGSARLALTCPEGPHRILAFLHARRSRVELCQRPRYTILGFYAARHI